MSSRARLLLAGVIALAAVRCSPPPTRPVGQPVQADRDEVPARLCQVGADGGIPVADRGIGGTGAPAPVRVADRGIGGTGAPAAGRTGIVGVITGFASICLAGQEVQYGPDVPVTVDGRAARLDALRAGQVAVIVAEGGDPMTARLAIRHEVSGPVEAAPGGDGVLVAGQRVVAAPQVPFQALPHAGEWVAVSGFRQADGGIIATRIDARAPGEVLVRGIMRMAQGRLWIGLVEIRPGRWQERRVGIPVVAIGRLNDGVLEADTVEVDALAADPIAFFGPAVQVLLLEGYAEGGVFRFGGRFQAGAAFGSGRALARLERGPGGGFAPATVRPGPGGGLGSGLGGGLGGGDGFRRGPAGGGQGFGPASRSGFQPAPVPNHGMERSGLGAAGGNRAQGPGPGPGQGQGDRAGRRSDGRTDGGGEGSGAAGGFGGAGGGFRGGQGR